MARWSALHVAVMSNYANFPFPQKFLQCLATRSNNFALETFLDRSDVLCKLHERTYRCALLHIFIVMYPVEPFLKGTTEIKTSLNYGHFSIYFLFSLVMRTPLYRTLHQVPKVSTLPCPQGVHIRGVPLFIAIDSLSPSLVALA